MKQSTASTYGQSIVNGTADFLTGAASAFSGIGNRFKRAKIAPFVEAFCAVIGDVASQSGRLTPKEREIFRSHIIANAKGSTILELYTLDQLEERMVYYAVSAFKCEIEPIIRAVSNIEDSELASLVIATAISVASSDGLIDEDERSCITNHAKTLGVDISGVFKQPSFSQMSELEDQNRQPCLMCKGKGCAFCKNTGYRSDR